MTAVRMSGLSEARPGRIRGCLDPVAPIPEDFAASFDRAYLTGEARGSDTNRYSFGSVRLDNEPRRTAKAVRE